MASKRVLSVGQCGPDHGSISRVLQTLGVEVVAAESVEEALERLRQESFALVLVNRVFDATAEQGLEFIRQVKGDDGLQGTALMLVSNYPEAQAEAVAAGALPGFGKNSLRERGTLEKLRTQLS